MSGRRKGQSVQLICGGNRCCGMRAQRRRFVSAHYRITDGDRYYSQKYECNNHPCEKINSESIGLHTRVTCVGSGNTRIGNEKRRERQPESAIGRERYSGTIVSHTIELTDGVKGTARHARQRLNVFLPTRTHVSLVGCPARRSSGQGDHGGSGITTGRRIM